MMVALFRIVEACHGRIEIDGVDISTLRLADLRRHVSIIPQDPTLFIGSIRYNLDPLEQYTDAEVWATLRMVHLDDVVAGMEGKLDAPVTEGGDNFSVGQRQLLCMARAVLKNSKILVMDEATASVDLTTDILIQQMVRTAFRDCTVLTIAHRLHTVMDSDRIMVLDAGRLAEFDKPLTLLADPKTIFSSLVNQANGELLVKLAKGEVDIESCLKQAAKVDGGA